MNEAIISHRGPGHLWLAGLGRRGMALGLDTTRALLERLERPDAAFPSVVVAGTDGKGSTSAMIAALLTAAGLRVGHYTSPHLTETRERVRVGPLCVTATALDGALVAVQEAAAQAPELEPTPFEALTAAALRLFAEAAVDVAVLEVGLGGRLDAVNATDPIVSVVTHLSHDHTAILGDTLAQIAFEKCGVARKGRMLAVAQAGLCKAALRRHGIEAHLFALEAELRVESFTLRGPLWRTAGVLGGPALETPLDVEIALPGRHQLDNTGLAVLAYGGVSAWWTRERGKLLPAIEDVVPALATLDWPCRAEVVEDDPLVILDAAHNPAGVQALAALLAERGKAWQTLLAVRKDRDPVEVVRALAPVTACFWLPRMAGETLRDASELAAVVDMIAPTKGVAVAPAARCMAQARKEVVRGSGVVATGSQHALGEWLALGVVQSPRLARWLG